MQASHTARRGAAPVERAKMVEISEKSPEMSSSWVRAIRVHAEAT